MIALELIEANLETIGKLLRKREPIPLAIIRNIKLSASLLQDVPEDNLNDFLNALDRLPVESFAGIPDSRITGYPEKR